MERGIEKLHPFLANMEDQRATDEEMFQPKTSCDSAKVEQVPGERDHPTRTEQVYYQWCQVTCIDSGLQARLLQPEGGQGYPEG